MPLVQPILGGAKILGLLHQERWRPVPCGPGWCKMLGGVLGRYTSSAIVPRSGNGNRRADGNAAGFAGRLLYGRWRGWKQIGEQRVGDASISAGCVTRILWCVP